MKNTSKKIAVYDPYLNTLGGGERLLLSIVKVFDDCGYEVDLLWDDSTIKEQIPSRLGLTFKNLNVIPNLLNKSLLEKINLTCEYNYLFYVTDGSYFFSRAKQNYIFSMFPQKSLYELNLINKIKLHNFEFVTISKFTKSFIDKWTKKKSTIIYPYLNDDYINFDFDNILKEKIILSVGRFFPHLHSKRHDIAIKNFKKLRASNESFKDFKLVLIGGLLQEDESYFRTLQSLASHDSHIIFITNAKYSEVYSFFQKAKYYWLCAGFGVDDTKEPTFVEHLGITPLEAMAMGCITFAYNAGGPKELIQNEKTGYLFKSEQQLLRQMHEIETNTTKQKSIQTQAKIYIQQNFTYPVFKDKVIKVFNLSQ